jgi:predicted transcriptional regulator
MRVTEVMKHPVRTVTPDQSVGEAAELMSQHWIEHLVVVEGGSVVGLISATDCTGVNPYVQVRDVMSTKPVTIESDELVSRAANLMRGHRIHSLIVTRNRKLAGIVTTSDLLRSSARERATRSGRFFATADNIAARFRRRRFDCSSSRRSASGAPPQHEWQGACS